MNLIFNAYAAMPKGGDLKIFIRSEPSTAHEYWRCFGLRAGGAADHRGVCLRTGLKVYGKTQAFSSFRVAIG